MGLPVKLAERITLDAKEFEETKGLIEEIPHSSCQLAAKESYWWPCRNAHGGAVIEPNSVFWLYFWAETGLGSQGAKDTARKVLCKIFGYGWDEADYNDFFALFDAALVSTGIDFRTHGSGNDPERAALRPYSCTWHCRDVFKKVLAYINAHDTPEERPSWCEKGQQMAVKVKNKRSGMPTSEELERLMGYSEDTSSSSPSDEAMDTSTEANTVASDDSETEVANKAKSDSADGATDEYTAYEKAASENRVVSDGTVCATREGRKILNVNYRYERSLDFIKKVKAMKSHVCDICGKNPDETYGRHPDDTYKGSIIEGHHIVPLSKYDRAHKVTEGDIALLCPNCHRVVHRMMGEDESATYSSVKEEIKALLEDEK